MSFPNIMKLVLVALGMMFFVIGLLSLVTNGHNYFTEKSMMLAATFNLFGLHFYNVNDIDALREVIGQLQADNTALRQSIKRPIIQDVTEEDC